MLACFPEQKTWQKRPGNPGELPPAPTSLRADLREGADRVGTDRPTSSSVSSSRFVRGLFGEPTPQPSRQVNDRRPRQRSLRRDRFPRFALPL